MPNINADHQRVLDAMHQLEILSELVAQEDKQYKHELDLDVILYGRGYTGGRVGPYVRLLVYSAGETLISKDDWAGSGAHEWDGNSFYILVSGELVAQFDRDARDERGTPAQLTFKKDDVIGAPALLQGEPAGMTVSVPKGAEATVLEFKRPALRLLRKYPKFAQVFDKHFRDHGLAGMRHDIEAATHAKLSADVWTTLTDQSAYGVYGKNHVLFEADDEITHVFLIHSGWVELTRGRVGTPEAAGLIGAAHLGPGTSLGLDAVAAPGTQRWAQTATLQARTELLAIPVAHLRRHQELYTAVRKWCSPISASEQAQGQTAVADASVAAARQHEIASGLVDATNLLVMDMDLCVRCGNCSLACQRVHEVYPHSRLVRHGIQIERPRHAGAKREQHVLAPEVCLHCQDPECLTGCPTGAIGRYRGGHIDINPATCIGCGDCATQCPYNAITLVPRAPTAAERAKQAEQARTQAAALPFAARLKSWAGRLNISPPRPAPELDFKDAKGNDKSLVAVKCNLCNNTKLNPEGSTTHLYSCELNCPTGALVRVNPREYFTEAGRALGVIYRSQTEAIGRNIHRRDLPARLWHVGGLLMLAVVVGATIWAATRYGLNTPLPGTRWTLRWLTGFAGLLSAAVVLAYVVRKQVYRRRWRPLRYWLLAHLYFGALCAALFLVHGGWHAGGPLTAALMVSFDLVIMSGLFGFACYKLAPRIMTRIEGAPLLVEELRTRRTELYHELEQLDVSGARLRPLVEGEVYRYFFTPGYVWRQWLGRKPLSTAQGIVRAKFSKLAEARGLAPDEHERLLEVVETAATLRRVDALIYLHRLLKLWLAPHVAFTVLMLGLLAAHLVQVFFFTVY